MSEETSTPKEELDEPKPSSFTAHLKSAMEDEGDGKSSDFPKPAEGDNDEDDDKSAETLPKGTTGKDDKAEETKPTEAELNFKALRQEKERIEREYTEARGEIDQLKERLSGYDPEEVDKLKAAIQKGDDTIKRLSLEADPRWQAEFVEKLESAISDATDAASDQAEMLEAVLRMPEGAAKKKFLGEIYEELDGHALEEVRDAARAVRKLQQERVRHTKDWRKQHEAMREHDAKLAQEEKSKHDAETARAQRHALGMFDRVLEAASHPEKGVAGFRERDGDAAWNEKVIANREAAKNALFGEITQPQVMVNTILAIDHPRLEEENALLTEKTTRLEKTIKELTVASPSTPTQASGKSDQEPKGFVERIKHELGQR
ncbi:MAG: hypothetical protein ACE5HE_00165 [Phycisphaerae bacterium]